MRGFQQPLSSKITWWWRSDVQTTAADIKLYVLVLGDVTSWFKYGDCCLVPYVYMSGMYWICIHLLYWARRTVAFPTLLVRTKSAIDQSGD